MQWAEIVFNNLKITSLKFNLQHSAVSGKFYQQMELNAFHALTIQELRITTQIVARTNVHKVKS
jgi:hypothetical protein